MARILFYRVPTKLGKGVWRVAIPTAEVGGYQRANFKLKADAARFYRAAKRELKASGRDKAVDFLTSPHKLLDALRALRLLRDVDTGPWQNRLTRGAALLAMLEENIAKEPGPFIEPDGRALELPPDLHRLLVAFARSKGANPNDLIAGLLGEWLKKENEAGVKFEEPRGRVRLGDLYRFSLPKERFSPPEGRFSLPKERRNAV